VTESDVKISDFSYVITAVRELAQFVHTHFEGGIGGVILGFVGDSDRLLELLLLVLDLPAFFVVFVREF
jgi:hypothetical protein